MKKTLSLLAILCLLLAQTAKAQLEKGVVLVGADVAGFEFGIGENAGFDISIFPKAAWFINNTTAIGLQAGVGFSKSTKDAATVTTYSIGPFGRYYLNDPTVNLMKSGRWFFEANAGIAGVNVSDGGGTTNGLNLGFGPGYAYFITPTIGFETLLKYNGLVGFGDETYQSRLSLNLGFQIYLPGKSTLNKVKTDVQ